MALCSTVTLLVSRSHMSTASFFPPNQPPWSRSVRSISSLRLTSLTQLVPSSKGPSVAASMTVSAGSVEYRFERTEGSSTNECVTDESRKPPASTCIVGVQRRVSSVQGLQSEPEREREGGKGTHPEEVLAAVRVALGGVLDDPGLGGPDAVHVRDVDVLLRVHLVLLHGPVVPAEVLHGRHVERT